MAARPEATASEPETFFWVKFRNELLDCIAKDGGNEEDFVVQFIMKKSILDKVNFMYEALLRYDLLDRKYQKDGKSDWHARRNFRKGNNALFKNKGSKSLRHYTYCIMKAKDESLLADAYANRSAILLKFGLFEECIEDIDRAFSHGYPEEKRASLVVRRNMAQRKCRDRIRPSFYEPLPHIPVNQRNPSIPGATRAIKLVTDETRRFRVVATKDIHVGQVMAIEECAGFSLDPAASVYHCHCCFELVYNPIPCLTCSQVVYCGKKCRERAYSTFHKHECPILKTMKHCCDEFKTFLIAMRLTFWFATEEQRELAQAINTLGEHINFGPLGDEILTATMISCLIYHMTKKHTTKFADPPNKTDEDIFKEQLTAHLIICFTHGSLINEYHPDPDVPPDSILRMRYMSQTVASGLYPHLYTRFRHSCAPNVQKFHHGTKRILRASRTIKKGEECFISYGAHYEYHSRERRQEDLLTSRHFRCDCKACVNDWVILGGETYLLDHGDDALVVKEVAPGNVDAARRYVEFFNQRIKEYEGREPHANLTAITDLAIYCYEMLANKREVI